MKVLVTGSAGLIGSHLMDYLREQGHEVYGADNYSIGKHRDPATIKVNLLNKMQVRVLMQHEFELVYHCAAWAHEGLSQFAPRKVTENNYNVHLNLLTEAINTGVRRFVVCSSMSVYGDQPTPFDETMPRQPVDIYAVAKTAVEQSTEILSRVHGIEYVILRPHNVYGPRQVMHDPYRNVVAIFMNRCLKGDPFYIYGDGEQKRAFSYVGDVVPAIARAGWLPVEGEIFNVGPTEEYTINQLAAEVRKNFPGCPKPLYVPDRPLEVKDAWCTNKKAIKQLGYETTTSFPEGIALMAKWAKHKGYQRPHYLRRLDIENRLIPNTWKHQLI